MRFVSHWPLGVPLLFLAYLPGGTRPGRGSMKRGVCTTANYATTTARSFAASVKGKGLGMRSVTSTAVRHTAAACSSWWRRGRVSGVFSRRSMGSRRRALVSSYSGHGLSIDATATPGANGRVLAPVDSADVVMPPAGTLIEVGPDDEVIEFGDGTVAVRHPDNRDVWVECRLA